MLEAVGAADRSGTDPLGYMDADRGRVCPEAAELGMEAGPKNDL